MAATPMYYVPTQHPGQLGQPVVTTAPGGAAYYAPSQGVVIRAAPQYEYTPNDYFMFSILTVAICGVISPLSLMFTIPALMFSRQSQNAAKMGDIDTAEKKGMIAAYLNITAITFSLFVAVLVTGLTLGLYGKENKCRYYSNC